MKRVLLIILLHLSLFFIVFAYQAQAEEENEWYVNEFSTFVVAAVSGEVIHGDKRAREMQFPTANLLPHNLIYPMKGVYAVKTIINFNEFKGIANFGERPTLDGKKLLLEVHLFDFDEDIYGKHLTVEFLTFIRVEKKFDAFSLLVEQIKKDIQISKDYHLSK